MDGVIWGKMGIGQISLDKVKIAVEVVEVVEVVELQQRCVYKGISKKM